MRWPHACCKGYGHCTLFCLGVMQDLAKELSQKHEKMLGEIQALQKAEIYMKEAKHPFRTYAHGAGMDNPKG